MFSGASITRVHFVQYLHRGPSLANSLNVKKSKFVPPYCAVDKLLGLSLSSLFKKGKAFNKKIEKDSILSLLFVLFELDL